MIGIGTKKAHLLASRVCTDIMAMGIRLASIFDARFADLDLTQAQFRILVTILDNGPKTGVSPAELAEFLLLQRPTVTVATTRMINKGLLSRKAGANRRTFQLVLTAKGKAAINAAIPKAIDLADTALRGLSDAQLRRVAQNLELVDAKLRAFRVVDKNARTQIRNNE